MDDLKMHLDRKPSTGLRLKLHFFSTACTINLVIGLAYAVFGSQSDVNEDEQLAALLYGIGMIVFGVAGCMAATKVKSKGRLRRVILCAIGALVSFVLALVFGP